MNPQNQKYDRQLRLWQAHGQKCLEMSHICLLNGSVVGAEALKNLILPSIGSFTVVDDQIVTGAHAGSNFFLDQESIGKYRSEALVRLLGELNQDVVGKSIIKDPLEIISSSPEFFGNFTMVVATELSETGIHKLAKICWSLNVPLIVARSYGFFGYCRFVKPEHTVIESHAAAGSDYRLDSPFPTLVDYVNGIDIASMDSMSVSHIPCVVLVLKALLKWRSMNDGALPKTSAEKAQFRQDISAFKHPNAIDDENITEALAIAYKAFSTTTIPSDITAILDDPAATNLSKNSSDFWILVAALKRFINAEGNGQLPVSGVVPDMKADTESFVKLQQIYRSKAREDQAQLRVHLDAILTMLGRVPESICNDQVELFCKNASSLHVMRYRSIEQEYTDKYSEGFPDNENMAYYWLLRAVDHFQELYGDYPGAQKETIDADVMVLETIARDFCKEYQIDDSIISPDHVHEVVRAGACELHNIASIVGGIVAQEAIKLLTSQYIPVNNTVIFNGIQSTILTFKC
ncbi:hypothetical protein BATDEDRAFT_36669 [Batrachochytrium dendrobatidis JAM81]|uniref:NEDD8-activating enzyme E1 regulatory subunit n=1 Tax=Batrachochytrium dendrobatidis (strain JAM81 / FGSC 10211) TaxID=684364 RepID=F4NWW1_BATDJ|nr:uncharacterized protein BATDEDRAFT_36669 [Batrachochytrium dendrobatidis JAM81]EGF82558.1 hypothetical protein BATDEDRAFT_36669 [Batrachochytrium dendrobatidis JAM81]|eukprot:XP_006676865.1 hypothetical protein BATDEDRAFT_36669 [Batrachochytrium dendrobatidis JAM81]